MQISGLKDERVMFRFEEVGEGGEEGEEERVLRIVVRRKLSSRAEDSMWRSWVSQSMGYSVGRG